MGRTGIPARKAPPERNRSRYLPLLQKNEKSEEIEGEKGETVEQGEDFLCIQLGIYIYEMRDLEYFLQTSHIHSFLLEKRCILRPPAFDTYYRYLFSYLQVPSGAIKKMRSW